MVKSMISKYIFLSITSDKIKIYNHLTLPLLYSIIQIKNVLRKILNFIEAMCLRTLRMIEINFVLVISLKDWPLWIFFFYCLFLKSFSFSSPLITFFWLFFGCYFSFWLFGCYFSFWLFFSWLFTLFRFSPKMMKIHHLILIHFY
jgi:hypothetical protein